MLFFGGMKLEAGSTRHCTSTYSFRVSGAAIEDGEFAKVYVLSEQGTFPVATLNEEVPQASLDLRFAPEEYVEFFVKGTATVYLTGSIVDDGN